MVYHYVAIRDIGNAFCGHFTRFKLVVAAIGLDAYKTCLCSIAVFISLKNASNVQAIAKGRCALYL